MNSVAWAIDTWFGKNKDIKFFLSIDACKNVVDLFFLRQVKLAYKNNNLLYVKSYIAHILKIPYSETVLWGLWDEIRHERAFRARNVLPYLRRGLFVKTGDLKKKQRKFTKGFWKDKISLDTINEERCIEYELFSEEKGFEEVESADALKSILSGLSDFEKEVCILLSEGYKPGDLISDGYFKNNTEWQLFRKKIKKNLKYFSFL
jgi:hypothetical protein